MDNKAKERQRRFYKKYPEKRREYRIRHRLKKGRSPCRICGAKMTYPSTGRIYCEICRVSERDRKLKRWHKEFRAKRGKYKLDRGCSKCGYKKCAAALHFHHKDMNKKLKRVLDIRDKEMGKCVILCANCHFEQHENGDI